MQNCLHALKFYHVLRFSFTRWAFFHVLKLVAMRQSFLCVEAILTYLNFITSVETLFHVFWLPVLIVENSPSRFEAFITFAIYFTSWTFFHAFKLFSRCEAFSPRCEAVLNVVKLLSPRETILYMLKLLLRIEAKRKSSLNFKSLENNIWLYL